MANGKIDRRSFLQIAATGVAAAAINTSSSEVKAMPNSTPPTSRPAPTFAYGYHEAPYPLEPGPHLFIDWRYVWPGHVAWRRADGSETPLYAYEKIEGVKSLPSRIPYGLRLVPQQAEKTGPLILNDRDWEFMISGACSLHDLGGKFGLWYEVVPPLQGGESNLLCYAESEDGINWKKPNLGLIEFRGSRANNIVIDGSKCPFGGFHANSVFIDPNAPTEERFKVVYWTGGIPEDAMARLKEESSGSVSPYGAIRNSGILLGCSPDGMQWEFTDKVLFSHTCDTQTTVSWDSFLKRYVCFTRTFLMGRRAIGRTETEDIWRWPAPETILWTPPDSNPADDLYCNSKSVYPGTKTMHLMFATMYKRRVDACALRMVSSLDTHVWQWLPGEVLQCGSEGTWDGGCLFAGSGLTEIPGDKVVLPYCGYEYPHKYPRFGRFGQIGFAVWPKERLVALEAEEDAEFWTPAIIPNGDTLYLNFDTKRAGYVKVEVDDVPGHTLEDCDPLIGNFFKKQVTWKGTSSIGAGAGKSVTLRIRMRCAKLYSFEFK